MQAAQNCNGDVNLSGFWTNRGACDKAATVYLKALHNKKLFLFDTAGFGESKAYYKSILQRTQKNVHFSVQLIGIFMCRGQRGSRAQQKYEQMKKDLFLRLYAA